VRSCPLWSSRWRLGRYEASAVVQRVFTGSAPVHVCVSCTSLFLKPDGGADLWRQAVRFGVIDDAETIEFYKSVPERKCAVRQIVDTNGTCLGVCLTCCHASPTVCQRVASQCLSLFHSEINTDTAASSLPGPACLRFLWGTKKGEEQARLRRAERERFALRARRPPNTAVARFGSHRPAFPPPLAARPRPRRRWRSAVSAVCLGWLTHRTQALWRRWCTRTCSGQGSKIYLQTSPMGARGPTSSSAYPLSLLWAHGRTAVGTLWLLAWCCAPSRRTHQQSLQQWPPSSVGPRRTEAGQWPHCGHLQCESSYGSRFQTASAAWPGRDFGHSSRLLRVAWPRGRRCGPRQLSPQPILPTPSRPLVTAHFLWAPRRLYKPWWTISLSTSNFWSGRLGT